MFLKHLNYRESTEQITLEETATFRREISKPCGFLSRLGVHELTFRVASRTQGTIL